MNAWVYSVVVLLVAIVTTRYFRSNSSLKFVQNLNQSYDYVIVGGGAAGLVLANRLTEDDVTVLVLEAGKSEADKTMYDVPYNAPKAQLTEADWIYRTVPQKYSQQGMVGNISIWPQGKGVGGSTLLNGLVYIRGSRYDYDSWAANGCEGWSYDDILPYFLKSENMVAEEGIEPEYHSRGGPLTVSDTTKTELADAYLEAAKELGYKAHDCNGNNGIQDGFCRMHAIVGNGQRCNVATGFLHPIMSRTNLHVATQAHVTKVKVEKKRAVGVELIHDGRKKFVSAKKEVLLSAGTIGSAQVLMLSGIGPKDHLQELGIPIVQDLPVGAVLQDHMMFFVKANIEKPVSFTLEKVNTTFNWIKYHLFRTGLLTSNAALEGNAFLPTNPDSNVKHPDIQYIMASSLAEHGDAFGHFGFTDRVNEALFKSIHDADVTPEGFSALVVLLHPKSKGSLRLASRDPFDYPQLDPNYLADPEDVKAFIRGIRVFQKFIRTTVMKKLGAKYREINIDDCKDKVPDSDEHFECLVRHLAVTVYHPVSTCKMGRESDPTAVVDPQLRVKGISGLRVIDASVMPSLTSGNTMAPVLMIAEKASDLIRNKVTVKKFYKR